MIFKIPVKVSVQCVCGAKLDAVLVDDPKYDFSVVVDNIHICPAAEQSVHLTAFGAGMLVRLAKFVNFIRELHAKVGGR